ncbi:LemA family protein [Posidoniimonas polymericola]|uniref:LemA family protein n=1 Tax=Posidoniimonas polymericola TaxID=2528002 RepID=A0A5C5ZE53_9BACT|nr:LemA family protein [Posidoniimonas polymericola]TWT85445.1 LemA family protein [Posidoniimonas polymericola]
MNEDAILPLLVLGVPLLLLLVFVIANFNRLVRVRQHIRESWADISVEMKRRYDLIPNLVETVKGYAAHEREIMEQVAKLRQQAMQNTGSAAAQAVDERALGIGVGRLLAVAEAYPDLKADAHFLALQQELTNTEDRIAASRRFYNGNVRELNQLCRAFPTNVLASVFGFEEASYFELEDQSQRAAPPVKY